ncbi:phosphatidylserine decarboxylase [Acetivibrio saccincola]|jgi:phosphatidylserine decarboxylase|uniref:Phosphatidylserine decarboxylase n=1 Tax=Acetivibrio saccincola TaxID=1677857 RepID=A0A2K9E124_9FIRM|nr:phosphatidylserine decarboxylase [Acetivibrio saccincola]AUG56058.1 Phosphatidylserine decarboxylase proenzyme [Acetivibrio saccincola]NLW27301.1 phosphatidylserine decarboxylase [Acetivibrio saccincola]PQQ65756.1 phosphatidylserine decarboxylase [Acetivibrio saccincola]HOA96219.1 phosphatidylserine decarboxylase [Acetivibrio saccincola]HQD27786.1 phosphatidylserine decarboxylase [Acetivibrio saccincola]
MSVYVYNRETKNVYEEKQFKEKQLKFLYETLPGRIILKFISGKWYSRYSGKKNSKRKSIAKIKPFIEKYGIDMEEYEKKEYRSFNEFFTRKIIPEKRPVPKDNSILISVADSKLRYYKIEENLSIKIKNSIYTVEELLGDRELAAEFKNGTCLVFRLTVDDCHRYCYFDNGRLMRRKHIDGKLHTVRAISEKRHKVYCENFREYSVLLTENFGKAVQMEVGALLVGKIVNMEKLEFKKGEEKGWFELGGSTIILFFQENTVKIDEDIVSNSYRGLETKVKYGERIGKKYVKEVKYLF